MVNRTYRFLSGDVDLLYSIGLIGFAELLAFHSLSVSWSWIVALTVIVQFGYLYYLMSGRKLFINFWWLVVSLFMAAVVWVLLTYFNDSSNRIIGYYISVTLIVGILFYLVRYFSIRFVVIIFLFVIVLHAQFGIFQFILQHDLGLSMLGESRIGDDIPGVAKFTFGSSKMVRAYGAFGHPNAYAGVLLLGFILVMRWRKIFESAFIPICGVLLIGIFLSFSRTSFVGLMLLMIISALIMRHHIRHVIFLVLIVLIVVATLSPLLISRFVDGEDVAVEERIVGLRWAMDIRRDLPWWRGVGIGSYPSALRSHLNDVGFIPAVWQIDYVHSVPVLLWLEWGGVGILFLAGVIGIALAPALRQLVWIIPIIPMLIFDHYFVTQFGPLLLLVVAVYLVIQIDPRLVRLK